MAVKRVANLLWTFHNKKERMPPVDVAKRFGENLTRLRKRAGLSQEDLAGNSELHRTVISQIETGKREARTSTIVKLAGGLSIDPGELFDGIAWNPPTRSRGSFETSPER